MWWKKNKWKVILPIVMAAILVFAFWYGGDSRGLHGWKVNQSDNTLQTEVPDDSETVNAETAASPEPTETPENTETPVEPEETENPNAEPETEEPPETAPETEPVEEAEKTEAPTEPTELHCTISISCTTILDHMDWLDPVKAAFVPANGWILGTTDVVFEEGESVFDVLQRVCREKKIHMEFVDTPMYQSAYIEGINNLYEFDCGELSGWMYKVNGWFPNYGCSRYILSDGDTISWVYTCDLGNDVGGGYAAG